MGWARERFTAAALNAGVPVILAPAHFLYFDHIQAPRRSVVVRSGVGRSYGVEFRNW